MIRFFIKLKLSLFLKMYTICSYIVLLLVFVTYVQCKYTEGVLKTSENWAFLARFCFLSEEGQFEYEIEYNEDQGDLNLLLYYDTDDQWPAAYKSNKTCQEKEALLNIRQNQIVNLTARYDTYNDLSGCSYLPRGNPTVTPSPSYTISVPTLPRKVFKKTSTNKVSLSTNPVSTFFTTQSSSTLGSDSHFESTIITTEVIESVSTENPLENATLVTDLIGTDYKVSTETELTTEFQRGEYLTKRPIKKRSLPITKPMYRQTAPNGRTILCHNARRFRSSRERWWFVAVSNCKGIGGINIRYKILMTNGPPGDYWHEHFSADEFYILPVLMAFSIAYSFLILGVVMCSIELRSRQLLHSTYKIFVFSTVVQFFGILFESISYLKYAVTGVSAGKIKRFGVVLMGVSETCFLLLLLLLAKGYTITRGRLPLQASIKLTIFMCVYSVTYIAIFIYEAKVFDPGEVLYLYESPAGYSLIALRIAAWCMFIYSTIFTLKHYPEKGNFYYPFNIFGTVWFIAGPAFILSANTYIDKWVRESVVCAVLLFITFGGHLMFLILTTPSVANKNFPYHVRTTQIGIMETMGNAGASSIDQFSHHVYEPTTTIREQTVIIPLTRRTEEIFEGMYNQRALQKNVCSEYINEEAQSNFRDTVLENVLNWSVAKNAPALELPGFERAHNRSSTTSSNSRLSDGVSGANKTPSGNFDDYVKEVPVELFTVSKMVVMKTNHVKSDVESD